MSAASQASAGHSAPRRASRRRSERRSSRAGPGPSQAVAPALVRAEGVDEDPPRPRSPIAFGADQVASSTPTVASRTRVVAQRSYANRKRMSQPHRRSYPRYPASRRRAGSSVGEPGDAEAGRLERRDLGGRGPGAARDDRAGVAHPLALRGGPAGDERDLGDVGQVLGGPGGGGLLGGAADLADQDDRVGLRGPRRTAGGRRGRSSR